MSEEEKRMKQGEEDVGDINFEKEKKDKKKKKDKKAKKEKAIKSVLPEFDKIESKKKVG